MDFFRNLLQLPSSVSVSMKIPKFKKLRQWSHDSIVNLSQLTIRSTNNNNNTTTTKQTSSENPLPTTGITTISSAIREQQIDPKKDNFGLYALKCDRSRSLANARRGILLNLPSSKIKLDGTCSNSGSSNFHSIERNHEIFKSCEILADNDSSVVHENPRKLDGMKAKVEPPPRKKKKVLAPTHLSALHHKPKQMAYQQVNKAGIHSTTISLDSLEKNDSGLYRIVGSTTETAKITYVEPKKKERIVAVVKPKVEKAITVKSTPMPRQISKVKSLELNRANQQQQQRRASKGSLKTIEVKKYTKSQSFEAITKSATDSIDIFKSNRIMDQRKLFDEFDELFEKNKAWEEKKEEEKKDIVKAVTTNQSPEIAFEKLRELKKQPSSSSTISSVESGNEDTMTMMKNRELIKVNDFGGSERRIYDKNLARAKYVNSLLQCDDDDSQDNEKENDNNNAEKSQCLSLKPKIISEQVKQHVEINKKKILYYDDENELQDMIMRQTQTTEMKSSTKLLTMDVNVKDCDTKEMGNLNKSQTYLSENKHPTQLISTNTPATNTTITKTSSSNSNSSNSLRIFSNEGDKIFVFHL